MIEALKKPVEETIKSADTEFAKTYATWEHKPKFIQKFKELAKSLTGSTTTNPKGSKNNPYPFVTRGTKVRRALMSANFSPKTRVGVLGSGSGRGGVIHISKKVNRPGIKKRGFEQLVAKVEEPKFLKRTRAGVKRAAKVSGQSI